MYSLKLKQVQEHENDQSKKFMLTRYLGCWLLKFFVWSAQHCFKWHCYGKHQLCYISKWHKRKQFKFV